MSVEAITVVLHHSRAKGTEKLVLLGIANHQGDGGAWPAIRKLATYANTTPRNVQKAIGRLVAAGELARYVQQGGTLASHAHDYERPNRYEVLLSCPPWCDRTTNHRTRKGWVSMGDGTYAPEPPPALLELPTAEDLEAQRQALDTVDVDEDQALDVVDDETTRATPTRPATPAPAETVEQIRRRLRGAE